MSLSEEPSPVFVNAYRGAANGGRYEQWRDEICRGICNMEINPTRDGVIDMETRIANLAPVVVATANGTSAAIGRTPQMAKDGTDDFTLVCRPHNKLPFRHCDDIMEVGRSEILLGDLTQSTYGFLGDCQEFTALIVERKSLLALAPHVEDVMLKSLRIPHELDEMIGRYAELASKASSHVNAHGRFLMGQHLIDLLALALGAHSDAATLASERGGTQTRLALMKADILTGLHRHDMSIGTIAHRYNLSARQAQRLFERDGVTFTEFVLERRLQLAHKLLRDPSHRRRKVSDIAHSAGFSDLSYFNRVFKRRFAMSPSEWRYGLL